MKQEVSKWNLHDNIETVVEKKECLCWKTKQQQHEYTRKAKL